MRPAKTGQGCDCRAKGGFGYLLIGSTRGAAAGSCAAAAPVAAMARPLPTPPTSWRRERGLRACVVSSDFMEAPDLTGEKPQKPDTVSVRTVAGATRAVAALISRRVAATARRRQNP